MKIKYFEKHLALLLSTTFLPFIFLGVKPFATGYYGDSLGISFTYETNNDSTETVTITKFEYTGNETNITIPDTIDQKKITSIAPYAFDCAFAGIFPTAPNGSVEITIQLPSSITTIASNAFTKAFTDTASIKSATIELPSSIDKVEVDAFYNHCAKTLTIKDPTRVGFSFNGWNVHHSDKPDEIISIGISSDFLINFVSQILTPSGDGFETTSTKYFSGGDIIVYAAPTWIKNQYSIEYHLEGHTLDETNPDNSQKAYTIGEFSISIPKSGVLYSEGDNVNLNAPPPTLSSNQSSPKYEFDGWYLDTGTTGASFQKYTGKLTIGDSIINKDIPHTQTTEGNTTYNIYTIKLVGSYKKVNEPVPPTLQNRYSIEYHLEGHTLDETNPDNSQKAYTIGEFSISIPKSGVLYSEGANVNLHAPLQILSSNQSSPKYEFDGWYLDTGTTGASFQKYTGKLTIGDSIINKDIPHTQTTEGNTTYNIYTIKLVGSYNEVPGDEDFDPVTPPPTPEPVTPSPTPEPVTPPPTPKSVTPTSSPESSEFVTVSPTKNTYTYEKVSEPTTELVEQIEPTPKTTIVKHEYYDDNGTLIYSFTKTIDPSNLKNIEDLSQTQICIDGKIFEYEFLNHSSTDNDGNLLITLKYKNSIEKYQSLPEELAFDNEIDNMADDVVNTGKETIILTSVASLIALGISLLKFKILKYNN